MHCLPHTCAHANHRLFWSWRGTTFSAVVTSWATYAHLLVFAVASTAQVHAGGVLPITDFALLRIAAIFSIVFYINAALQRFTARFHDFSRLNGNCNSFSAAATGLLPQDKPRCTLLLQYANLIMHLHFLAQDGVLCDHDWKLIMSRQLATPFEASVLQQCKNKPIVVAQWAVRLLEELRADGLLCGQAFERLLEFLTTIRNLGAKQMTYQAWSLPLPLIHSATLLLHLLALTEVLNCSSRFADAFINGDTTTCIYEPLAAMLSISILVSMWVLAVQLSDPVGDDVIDWDLDNDLKKLWRGALESLAQMPDGDGGVDRTQRILGARLGRGATNSAHAQRPVP